MDNYLLNKLKNERKTYVSMVEFCTDNLILNNYIMPELIKQNFYFELYSGDDMEYLDTNGDEITRKEYDEAIERGEDVSENVVDIYQYFIIDGGAAERFKTYTNEIVFYCEDLDLYLLGVTHCGTSWDYVPSAWRDELDDEE